MDHNQPLRSARQHPCQSSSASPPSPLPRLPWARSDPIPAITLTTAAPGAALELDGLMTRVNGR